jgi:2-dehydropantoate 2-reductase
MNANLKYAIIGSGAVGSYYGGKLAQSGGCDVHFLMRSDLDFVQKLGLTIRSKDGEVHLPRVNAARTTEEIGPCDVVLIALKTTANAVLPNLIPPLLKPDTLLITLQNGLGNEEFLAQHFGAERVLGGLCFVCLNRVGHGVIEHYGHGTLSIGEFGRPPQERTRRIVSDFQRSGIEASAVENLIIERWRKLVWNIPFNGLGIAARATVADVLQSDELHLSAKNLMRETIEAAGALGHAIPMDFIEFQIARSWPMGPYRSSSQIDFEAGREVEVEAIWGEPYRHAVRAGANAPRLELLYALIKRLAAMRCEAL